MRGMVNAFKELGHEVELCIIGGTTKEMTSPAAAKVPFGLKNLLKKIVPHIIWSSLKDREIQKVNSAAYHTLEAKVKTFDPDLIYERAFYLMPSGCDISEKYTIPHIVEINSPYEYEQLLLEGKTLLTGVARKVEKKLLTQPDLVCAVSSSIKSYFLERHPEIDEKKIIVTPNAVIGLAEKSTLAIPLKEKLNGKTVVGFVGSIFAYHGVDKLIEASAKTNPLENNLALLIVGNGSILGELKQLTVDLNIAASVQFTGQIEHTLVSSYIDLMDITVLANTEWYCSPVKLFDYGLQGKAIVAINQPGVTDVMTNNLDGLIINNNEGDLVDAINQLASDKPLRESLGTTFQKKILSQHTWKATAQKVLSTLEEKLK